MSNTSVTKYEHACLILEKDGTKLVIDPGCFTQLPDVLEGIAGVVITEEHTDHFDLANLKTILQQNPEAQIFTTQAAHETLTAEKIASTAIEGDQTVECGGFQISLYETDHATIYGKSPCRSLAVKVDDFLYYPSDTYHAIGDAVKYLALPMSGPWHKVSEAVELAHAIKSEKIIATHNGLYNEAGHAVANGSIKPHVSESDREYIYLEPGQSVS